LLGWFGLVWFGLVWFARVWPVTPRCCVTARAVDLTVSVLDVCLVCAVVVCSCDYVSVCVVVVCV